jgi:hypothetical protein
MTAGTPDATTTDARLEAHVRHLVDAAPPLTPRQKDHLTALLTAHSVDSRVRCHRSEAAA